MGLDEVDNQGGAYTNVESAERNWNAFSNAQRLNTAYMLSRETVNKYSAKALQEYLVKKEGPAPVTNRESDVPESTASDQVETMSADATLKAVLNVQVGSRAETKPGNTDELIADADQAV